MKTGKSLTFRSILISYLVLCLGNAHSYDHRLQQFDLLCAERNTKFSCIAYERSYGED